MVRADPRPQLRCRTCGQLAEVDDDGLCVACFDRRVDHEHGLGGSAASAAAAERRTGRRMQEHGRILIALGDALEADVPMAEAVRRVAEEVGRTERTVYRAVRQWRLFQGRAPQGRGLRPK